MDFLSKFFDFVFPSTGANESDSDSSSSLSTSGIADNFFEHESMLVNPANGMPMMGGTCGFDVLGNPWGHSDTLGDNHSHHSSVDHSAESFGSNSMFDSGSMFD
jgi:hypothetical protein